MNNLIEKIKKTYLKRTVDIPLQKELWLDLALFFKPDIKNYRVMRPSALIAKETGDLGLSVLWIVQTALARPLLNDLVLSSPEGSRLISLVEGINDFSICALAHSESKDDPVTIHRSEDGFILNGMKKFITAGVNADYILITCRSINEEKINSAVLFDNDSVPGKYMTDLNLDIMRSINHTSMTFSSLYIPEEKVPEVDAAALRRSIKKWSLIERGMIIEAFIPFMIYFNRIAQSNGLNIIDENILHDLAIAQSNAVAKQLDEAFYNSRITTENIKISELLEIVSIFNREKDEITSFLDESEKLKFKDIFIFEKIK